LFLGFDDLRPNKDSTLLDPHFIDGQGPLRGMPPNRTGDTIVSRAMPNALERAVCVQYAVRHMKHCVRAQISHGTDSSAMIQYAYRLSVRKLHPEHLAFREILDSSDVVERAHVVVASLRSAA
jgi:hypothetical protein